MTPPAITKPIESQDQRFSSLRILSITKLSLPAFFPDTAGGVHRRIRGLAGSKSTTSSLGPGSRQAANFQQKLMLKPRNNKDIRFEMLWWCIVAALLAVVHCAPNVPQIVLSNNGKSRPYLGSSHGKDSFTVNMTFDKIDLIKSPNQTLTSIKYIEFERFEVFNVTGANQTKLIEAGDMDCAASMPNALRSIPQKYPAPAIFRSNATALNAANVSEYFDFVSFSIKPLGPTGDWPYIELSAWLIEDGVAKDVQSLGIGFAEAGFQEPFDIEPRLYFDNWGEKVNFMEIQTYTGELEPWEFCVDNIVLDFHKLKDNSD